MITAPARLVVCAVVRANMVAMWLAGRFFATLLALLTAAGMVCVPAQATPDVRYGQPPVWGSCRQFLGDTAVIATAQCATVAVPLDWAAPDATNPEAAQAQLAVIRVPAMSSDTPVCGELTPPSLPAPSSVMFSMTT